MQTFRYVLVAFVVAFIGILFSTSANAAWSGPIGATPPTGPNVAPPLNVSGAGQEKLGGITLGLQLFNPFAANAANCPPGSRSTVSNCSQGFFSSGPTFRPIAGNDPLGADGFGLKVVNGRVLSFGSANPYDPDGAGFCLAGINKPLRCLTWSDFDWLYNSGHGSGGGTTVNVRQESTSITNSTSTTVNGGDTLWTRLTNGKLGNVNTNNGIDVTGKVTTLGPNKGFCIGTICIDDWLDLNGLGVGGIERLTAGSGILFNNGKTPITTTGEISADSRAIVSTIGSCNAGNVLKGIKADGTADCVPAQTCVGDDCPPVVVGIDGSGTRGYIPVFSDPKKIANSMIVQRNYGGSNEHINVMGQLIVDKGIQSYVPTGSVGRAVAGFGYANSTGVYGEGNGTGSIAGNFVGKASAKALATVGPIALTGIGEADKKVLASDASGNATWRTLAELGGGSTPADSFWEKAIGIDGVDVGDIRNKNDGNVRIKNDLMVRGGLEVEEGASVMENVGIGTRDPEAKLDVVGKVVIRPSGDVLIGTPIDSTVIDNGPVNVTPESIRKISLTSVAGTVKSVAMSGKLYVLSKGSAGLKGSYINSYPISSDGSIPSQGSHTLLTIHGEDHARWRATDMAVGSYGGKTYIYAIALSDGDGGLANTSDRAVFAFDTSNDTLVGTYSSTWRDTCTADTVFAASGLVYIALKEVSYAQICALDARTPSNLTKYTSNFTFPSSNFSTNRSISAEYRGYRYTPMSNSSGSWVEISPLSVSKVDESLAGKSLIAGVWDAILGIFTGGGNTSMNVSSETLLAVGGKVQISDGTQGANKVLASDANGVASWKTKEELGLGGGGGGCTISGQTITCGSQSIIVPTATGGNSCTISGRTITCGSQSVTVPEATVTPANPPATTLPWCNTNNTLGSRPSPCQTTERQCPLGFNMSMTQSIGGGLIKCENAYRSN